jgi:hypothetical protein
MRICFRREYLVKKGMTTKRPAHLKPPAHLSKSPPVPVPKPMQRAAEPDPERLDPVRYGDWEISGIAVDF